MTGAGQQVAARQAVARQAQARQTEPRPVAPGASGFGGFVAAARARGQLVVQPRMGFADPAAMRAGLLATRDAAAVTVGTVTLDSYTRIGDHDAARAALAAGAHINGYPLVAHPLDVTAAMLDGVVGAAFPVQVRHGSARPQGIVSALAAAGLHATEGGPVSYCLPYGRVPLRESVANWAESCRLLAELRTAGREPHLETFGGCMMGQLCPPSLLVALSVLEALFFCRYGIRDVSLSYAQQTSAEQDEEAVAALRRLATELLPTPHWHIVLYTYMGVYPYSPQGAADLLAASARLAVRSGAARLIVKTSAEAFRIPTVAENTAALELASRAAAATRPLPGAAHGGGADDGGETYAEARALIEAVLDLDDDLARALPLAFDRGHLDVPYCLHPDNRGAARSRIDEDGRLRWTAVGTMPIRGVRADPAHRMDSTQLLTSLSYVRRRFDRTELDGSGTDGARPALPTAPAAGAAPVPTATPTATTPISSTPTPTPTPTPIPTPIPRNSMALHRQHARTTLPAPGQHLASPTTRAALRLQGRLLSAARERLREAGFTELLPPVIGPVTDPGNRGAKQVDIDYYGHRYKLMTSAILYKQASLLAFDKIFYVAPNVRLEPVETASTSRHLTEFHQLDVEVAGATREEVLSLLEDLLRHMVGEVVRTGGEDLAVLGRDPQAFADLLAPTPFERLAHATAVERLHEVGHPQSPDAEIDWAGEALLSEKSAAPFFVTDYPKGSRGFYDREDPENPGELRNFDLIAPEGYGELCSGSEREYDYQRIVTRMRETGENPAKYGWYLDLVREGIPASTGFGLGIQRLTRYVAGLDEVWQASAFPKLVGVVSP